MLRISWRPKLAPSSQYHVPYTGFISTLHLLSGSKNAHAMLRFCSRRQQRRQSNLAFEKAAKAWFEAQAGGLGRIRHYTTSDGVVPGELELTRRDRLRILWFSSPMGLISPIYRIAYRHFIDLWRSFHQRSKPSDG
jgi:hypothetical protein